MMRVIIWQGLTGSCLHRRDAIQGRPELGLCGRGQAEAEGRVEEEQARALTVVWLRHLLP